MEGDVLPKLSKHKIPINENNMNQSEMKNKGSKSFKISKYNKDKIFILKHKSNLNINHGEHLNPIILSNNKPKYQSQKFIILPKYMKDKIFLLNLPSSKKNNKDKIIIKKKSSKIHDEENNKNNELLKDENFENMPSFTKELRNALYSNSNISLDNGLNKNEIENNSEKNSSEEKKKKEENDSSKNSETEENNDRMHEDNQTLMDVIKDQNLNDNDNMLEKKNNSKNDENNINEIINNKDKNNYKYQDVLLTISTTMPEVGLIKSNFENVNKIITSNYSTNITNESNSHNSDINNSINIISSQNEIKIKTDSNLIDINNNDSHLKEEEKKITEKNIINPPSIIRENGIYKKERAQEILDNIKNQNMDDDRFKAAYEFIARGEEEKGLDKIREFLQANPRVWNAWFMLGWGLRKLGRFSDAKQSFLKSLECDGGENNADTYNELALCYIEDQNYKDAMKCFENALTLDSENTKVMSNMAYLYLKMGQKDMAKSYFQAVLEFDPNDKIARMELEKL